MSDTLERLRERYESHNMSDGEYAKHFAALLDIAEAAQELFDAMSSEHVVDNRRHEEAENRLADALASLDAAGGAEPAIQPDKRNVGRPHTGHPKGGVGRLDAAGGAER